MRLIFVLVATFLARAYAAHGRYKQTGGNQYCGNRGSSGGGGAHSFIRGSLSSCAETVFNNKKYNSNTPAPAIRVLAVCFPMLYTALTTQNAQDVSRTLCQPFADL